VPLIERNLPVTERRMPVIVATPALQERALAKSAALVARDDRWRVFLRERHSRV
jgi:hypothetical protein